MDDGFHISSASDSRVSENVAAFAYCFYIAKCCSALMSCKSHTHTLKSRGQSSCGVRIPEGTIFLSRLQSLETGSEAPPASYPTDTRAFVPVVTWSGCDAYHSRSPGTAVKNVWRYVFTAWCLIKHRNSLPPAENWEWHFMDIEQWVSLNYGHHICPLWWANTGILL